VRGELDILKIEENSTVIVFYVSIWGSLELCLGGCCKLSVRVALNVRFTTNGICAKNHHHERDLREEPHPYIRGANKQ